MARSLRQLAAVGIVERVDHRSGQSGRFEASVYRVDLGSAGLTVQAVAARPDSAACDTAPADQRRFDPDPSGDQLSLLR
ncbi:MAG: hypothetical protein GY798_04310 [Hyphomicrobiales bacterium]|nr:hypothetical protein [Hyphomicrobiales bacterium]